MLCFCLRSSSPHLSLFFFFNDTATTEIYTLSLHDALPIFAGVGISRLEIVGLLVFLGKRCARQSQEHQQRGQPTTHQDRKSTRLNSSHQIISYAVFCLKKKKKNTNSR